DSVAPWGGAQATGFTERTRRPTGPIADAQM
ncbi:MAG: hypothetical protein JWQ60_3629, partial [Pseudonocardia sp.]|nr:hypothetical protein [Pseudonocardia sp.]